MDIQMRGGRAHEWGMGEGVFPNMAEQPAGHGYSHPAHLDAQEIGTHTTSSPAGSAALPGPGEGAAKPGTACPPARLAQKQDGHHLCTWAGSAFCLSNQPLVSNLTIGRRGLPPIPSSSTRESMTGGHPTHHHGLQAASSSQGPGSVPAWEESMERTCLRRCFFCAQPMALPFGVWLQTAQGYGH